MGKYTFGEGEVTETFETQDEEGFVQLAATQPAPRRRAADKDLYRPRSDRTLGGLEPERAVAGQGT